MKPAFIVIGLCLVGAGAVLSVIGHYDGVLGASDPEAMLAREETSDARIRAEVVGAPDEAQERFQGYRSQLVLPAPMIRPMAEGEWVPVRIAGTAAEAFLRVDGPAPAPGSVLVFTGNVQTFRPMLDAGEAIVGREPILFLEPVDVHEPIMFKR